MGRRRKNALDAQLPSRVYLHHGAYLYRPPAGKSVRLGTSLTEALRAHAKLVSTGVLVAPPAADITSGNLTVGTAIDLYIAKVLPTLAPDTQTYYLQYLSKIRRVFAGARPEDVRPSDIYAFRSQVSESATVQGLLTRVFGTLFRFMIELGAADTNPCRDVTCSGGARRTRCPDSDEISLFKVGAGPFLALYVDFKLMTGLRQKDLLELAPIALSAAEFKLEVSKSRRWDRKARARVGREETYDVTEELRGVLQAVYALPRPQSTEALFCTRAGRPYSSEGFRSVWVDGMTRAVARAGVAGVTLEPFHEHDLRATTATADEANAQRRLQHRDRTTTDIYLRRFRSETVTPLSLAKVAEASTGKR